MSATTIRRAAQGCLWLALIVAVTMALLPQPPHTAIDRFGDKFAHMLAFAVLTILAAAGFPGTPLLRIGERLSFLGALIEVFQSIPALHRDCDPLDWLADTGMVIAVLLVVAAWRHGLGASAAP